MKSKQERIKKANKTYCDGHDQEGIKICRWENMPGWQKFLKGEITETQLSVEAKQELAELDQAFGKYLRSDSDREKDTPEPPQEDQPAGKARIASKIYRQACVDSGKSLCFFKNFTAWQEFVHGEIGEDQFYEKAREEILKSAVEQRSNN